MEYGINTRHLETLKRFMVIVANPKSDFAVPPIGAAYIASSLANAGCDVRFVDLTIEPSWVSRLKRELETYQADFIGISIRNLENVEWISHMFYLDRIRDEVLRTVRAHTSAPIIIGGSGVNVMPREVLRYLDADYAIRGDGEQAIVQFVRAWNTDELRTTPGLLTREDVVTAISTTLDDYDPLHQARLPQLNGNLYHELWKWTDTSRYTMAAYPIQTRRGCSLACQYCVYPNAEGTRFRLRPPKEVLDEVQDVYEKTGIAMYNFIDSIFNVPPAYCLDVVREIIARKLPVAFITSGGSPKFLTPELVDLLPRANFNSFALSPETAAPAVMKLLGKGYQDQESLIQATQLMHGSPVAYSWSFLFGLPGETQETVLQTTDFIKAHIRSRDPVWVGVGTRIYPNTPLEQTVRKEGNVPEAVDWLRPWYYEPPGICIDEIHALVREQLDSLPNVIFWATADRRQLHPLAPLGWWAGKIASRCLPNQFPSLTSLVWRNAMLKLFNTGRRPVDAKMITSPTTLPKRTQSESES